VKFRLPQNVGNPCLDEQLLASHERIFSIEVDSWMISKTK